MELVMSLYFAIPQELSQRRSLLYQLVLKELKTRYARPALGFFWAFLSPFLTVLIFYLVFACFLKIKIAEAPFTLYLMTSVFGWGFFQGSLSASVTCLVDSRNLVKEAKFPHYLIPVSITLANAINFLPVLVILVIVSFLLLRGLPVFILALPLVLAIHLALTTGIAIILSILYVRWRDLKYVLDAALMLLFYSTPVFYSVFLVKDYLPKGVFLFYLANPFVGILNFYRICLLKGFYPYLQKDLGLANTVLIPFAFTFLVFGLASWLYARQKDKINDYLSY
jgi:lipopolysaccharide transport system permease protein